LHCHDCQVLPKEVERIIAADAYFNSTKKDEGAVKALAKAAVSLHP
jgi:hypothetical protein